MMGNTKDAQKTIHPHNVYTNLLLFNIVLVLISILWSINKSLRRFIYHESRSGIMFYHFSWRLDRIEEVAVTGDKRLIPCEKSIYILNTKIATSKDETIYKDGTRAKDICETERYEMQVGYWYPYRYHSAVGLFDEILEQDKEPILEKEWLVDYMGKINPVQYEAYMERVASIETQRKLKECLKTGSYDYCKRIPTPYGSP